MTAKKGQNVVLCVTGGSGAVIAKALATAMLDAGLNLHFVCSRYGRLMWHAELGESLNTALKQWKLTGRFFEYKPDDLTAPIASGSFPVRAVAIVPCSLASAAAIANGVGANLIHRAADVAIKERTPLLIVPRESPLSAIHLRNLLTLSQVGAVVLPPMPAFYKHPTTIDDVVDEVVQRCLVLLGLRDELPESMQYGLERLKQD